VIDDDDDQPIQPSNVSRLREFAIRKMKDGAHSVVNYLGDRIDDQVVALQEYANEQKRLLKEAAVRKAKELAWRSAIGVKDLALYPLVGVRDLAVSAYNSLTHEELKQLTYDPVTMEQLLLAHETDEKKQTEQLLLTHETAKKKKEKLLRLPAPTTAFQEWNRLRVMALKDETKIPDDEIDKMTDFRPKELVNQIVSTLERRIQRQGSTDPRFTEAVNRKKFKELLDRGSPLDWFRFFNDEETDPAAFLLNFQIVAYLKDHRNDDWIRDHRLPTPLRLPRIVFKEKKYTPEPEKKKRGKTTGGGIASKSLGHILHKFAAPDEDYPISRSLGSVLAKARQPPSVIQSLAKKPKL
jgi:hypothetical protein